MKGEPNPYDHLNEDDVPDEESSLEGTTSPVGKGFDQDSPGVNNPIVALIDRKVKQLALDVNYLNRVNVELLMTDMLELADELGRLQTNLSSIYTPDDVREIANLKRYRGPKPALERIEIMYSNAGRVSQEGMSSITATKNLMNRFQEKLRLIEKDRVD